MQCNFSRREMLARMGTGLGTLGLASLLAGESAADGGGLGNPLATRPPHFAPRAKRVIHLYMNGGPSQVDTFDYKPALIKKHGEKFDPGGKVELFQSVPGTVMKSPWKWRQHGQCGKWISDLLPHLAGCVDEMAFLPAMVAKSSSISLVTA